MARRRLRKRQGPSRLKVGAKVISLEGARQGYEALKGLYTGAKAIKAAAASRDGRKMKKKMPPVWSDNDGNGIKYHTRTMSYKKQSLPKLYEKLSQPGSIYQYSTGGGSTLTGKQGVFYAGVLDGTAINDLYANLNYGGAPPAYQKSRKMYYKGSQQKLQFCNAGNSTMSFTTYICIDKTSNIAQQAPLTVWNAAILDEQNDLTGSIEDSSDLWMKPTSYKAFNIAFWTKKIQCTLTAGEKCELTLNMMPHRLLDSEYLARFQSIRGITYHIMVVQHGSLVDSTRTITVTAGGQSIGPSKLIYLLKRRLFGSIIGTLPRVNKQLGSELPSVLAAAFHIDEDNGEPEDAQDGNLYA